MAPPRLPIGFVLPPFVTPSSRKNLFLQKKVFFFQKKSLMPFRNEGDREKSKCNVKVFGNCGLTFCGANLAS